MLSPHFEVDVSFFSQFNSLSYSIHRFACCTLFSLLIFFFSWVSFFFISSELIFKSNATRQTSIFQSHYNRIFIMPNGQVSYSNSITHFRDYHPMSHNLIQTDALRPNAHAHAFKHTILAAPTRRHYTQIEWNAKIRFIEKMKLKLKINRNAIVIPTYKHPAHNDTANPGVCKYVLHDNHPFVIICAVYEREWLCVTVISFDLMITKEKQQTVTATKIYCNLPIYNIHISHEMVKCKKKTSCNPSKFQ